MALHRAVAGSQLAARDVIEAVTGREHRAFTHHALTMARMHRLFGVTMLERGVSQLVSVNLAEAETLVDEKSAA